MPFDGGTSTISSAGTRETLANDLVAANVVIADSRIMSITVIGDQDNTGDVFFAGPAVASGVGVRLEPGDSFSKDFDGGPTFDEFYGDADTAGDKINWAVEFAQ